MTKFIHVTALSDESNVYSQPVKISLNADTIRSVAQSYDFDTELPPGTGSIVVVNANPFWFFALEECYDDVMGQLL